ncbi:MAG: hypothetical protein ISS46_00575 [Candidatus Omnitrophica bacterium]|nr:hypothetical protein [Candidatus Omnitrophota bacterium]
MKKREKIIGIIMLAAIVIWGIMYLPKPHREKVEAIKSIERPARKPIRVSGPKMSGFEPSEQFDLQRLIEQTKLRAKRIEILSIRDPFEKLEPKMSKLGFSDLVLSGIIWDKEAPLAIINDHILKEGDTISDFEIEEIREDEVVLVKGMERYVLKAFTEK